MKYSKTTNGFYLLGVHADIPTDAVDISSEQHAALMKGQALGQMIQGGNDGHPVLCSPLAPSDEDLSAAVRHQRDRLLAQTDWTQVPDVPRATSARWTSYRAALREVPSQPGFPNVIEWPVSPA